jgi:two-component system nitrogen regulation response regulator GlnG
LRPSGRDSGGSLPLGGLLPADARFSLKELADRAAAEAERQAIRLALHATRGNKSEATRLLRVDYKSLHPKMKRYVIDAGNFRTS